MKKLILFITCIYFIGFAFGQNNNLKKPEEQIRKYWFVMLMKGPNRNQDSVTDAKIQVAHMANINNLYNQGKLKVAGPFEENDKWLGIFIFDCTTKEEVEKLLQTDLAVSSGRLSFEIQGWYTSPTGSFAPGIPKVNE